MKELTTTSIRNSKQTNSIIIKGAKVNNLQNIDIIIPRNKIIVITGLSGSGKSSFAFDTIFAEGHRMYVESLSSYTRQFIGKVQKPSVDYIRGLSPAIALEQKTNSKNPRSTVGTITEIYDYLKILFSRIGKTYSPKSGKIVKKDTTDDIIAELTKKYLDEKIYISFPISTKKLEQTLKKEIKKGFTRIVHKNEIINIIDILDKIDSFSKTKSINIFVDRLRIRKDDENLEARLTESINVAFYESKGTCYIHSGTKKITFNDKFERDGIKFEEPTTNFFNFNNPYGACTTCEGLGFVTAIDDKNVIPNNKKSIQEGAVSPWQNPNYKKWLHPLLNNHLEYKFDIEKPYFKLSDYEMKVLWNGHKNFKGIRGFFDFVESQSLKIQYKILLSKYKGLTKCKKCFGTRIREDAAYVKINDKSIMDLLQLSISDLEIFFRNIELTEYEASVSKNLLEEINSRIFYLKNVGLDYLSLDRGSNTLSGGEYQRINLATSLGSTLVGTMYILDEPTIGLHPRDTNKLANIIKALQRAGNTVIIVEHDEEIMKIADEIIDIGPEAGSNGGKVVFQGSYDEIMKAKEGYTAKYLQHKDIIPIPKKRRTSTESITIKGARENNLKDIDVQIPLGVLTVITGVSGSGKSTLIREIVYPAIGEKLFMSVPKGAYDSIEGNLDLIDQIEYVDQNPILKSSRSNAVTYLKAYDSIRHLLSKQPISKERKYNNGTFSFNIDGGRCPACKGEGISKIEMQFMADITLECDQCYGKRFKDEILDVLVHGKNISDILDMTVEDAMLFFKNNPEISEKLQPLMDVGMGYIRLGQSSSTFSGGEAQRLKLASYIKHNRFDHSHKMYIFDEPTTGLHFHDINKLLKSFNTIVDQGNTMIIIEHNLEIIKSADWIIDLGPGEGKNGGNIVFEGTPEEMIKLKNNETAKYLREKF